MESIFQNREKSQVGLHLMHESFYNARESKLDQIDEILKKIKVMKEFKNTHNSDYKSEFGKANFNTQNLQTKAFPLVNIDQLGDEPLMLNSSFAISSKIFDTSKNLPLSALHRELFEYNLGLVKPDLLDTYNTKPYISSLYCDKESKPNGSTNTMDV